MHLGMSDASGVVSCVTSGVTSVMIAIVVLVPVVCAVPIIVSVAIEIRIVIVAAVIHVAIIQVARLITLRFLFGAFDAPDRSVSCSTMFTADGLVAFFAI